MRVRSQHREGSGIGRWVAAVLIGGAIVIVIAIVLIAQSGDSSSSASRSSAAKTMPGLKVGYWSPPESLDPQQSQTNYTWPTFGLAYECLLRATPEGDVDPSLATELYGQR